MTDDEKVLLIKAIDDASKVAELLCQLENLQAQMTVKELQDRTLSLNERKACIELVGEVGKKILEHTLGLNELVGRIYQGMGMEPFIGFSNGIGAARALSDARMFWLANPNLELQKQGG